MLTALILGLATFVACWLLHVIMWRIHRPEAYPIWLPIIFLLTPVVSAITVIWTNLAPSWMNDQSTIAAAFLLHAAISSCYMGGYAGVIEYSPSAEILRAVEGAMPEGIAPEALNVTTLSEQALTGKRIRHLATSRMIREHEGVLTLTPRGSFVVAVCRAYRAMFGLKQAAKG